MFNIIGKHRGCFLISGILGFLSIAALVVSTVRFGTPLGLSSDPANAETFKAAGWAILAAAIITSVFTWWSFRHLSKGFRYGVCAIAAMLHDLLVACGFYALMGIVAGWEADVLFFTAILIVIGFSTQSVIAVLDRIRENTPKRLGEPYEVVVNRSILETLNPSLATRACTAFVMVALILLGGTTIRPFTATLLVGMVSATYSAIFIAAPLLAIWEKAPA
jgi:preprotein translocase subunit SecF